MFNDRGSIGWAPQFQILERLMVCLHDARYTTTVGVLWVTIQCKLVRNLHRFMEWQSIHGQYITDWLQHLYGKDSSWQNEFMRLWEWRLWFMSGIVSAVLITTTPYFLQFKPITVLTNSCYSFISKVGVAAMGLHAKLTGHLWIPKLMNKVLPY